MEALSSNLTGTVQNAASGLQALLDAQLSNLGSRVQGVSSSMKSAEHDLHAKMYALEHSEAAHDASQQSTINRLHDIQNNVQVQTKGAAVALAANVSQVQELVDVGLTKLQADEIADKKTMLSKILIEVASLKTAVERAISVQQTDMETVVTRSLNRMDLALTREKSTALSVRTVVASTASIIVAAHDVPSPLSMTIIFPSTRGLPKKSVASQFVPAPAMMELPSVVMAVP